MHPSTRVLTKLNDGSELLVEVTDMGPGYQPVSQRVSTVTAETFASALGSIRKIADEVRAATSSLGASASLEFAIDFSLETGALTAVLAKGSSTATFKVTLSWMQAEHDR